MTQTILRNIGHVYQRMSQLDLSNVFLMVSLQLWGLGRKTREVECHFHYTPSKVLQTHTLSLLILTLITWLRSCLLGFPTVKLLPSLSAFHLYSLEGIHYVQPTLQEQKVMLHKDQFLHEQIMKLVLHQCIPCNFCKLVIIQLLIPPSLANRALIQCR